MNLRILDLDGSIAPQTRLGGQHRSEIVPLIDWGPRIRLGCSFGRFEKFESELSEKLPRESDTDPALTLYGSGDFHHVSLALVRRLHTPFNLLVLDNHPDWMRGIPLLHCGTWLYHAARLPLVQRVFHTGGDVDFDNYYRRMAPWKLLRNGKIVVFPGVRRFTKGWSGIEQEPLRPSPKLPLDPKRLERLLDPYRRDLEQWPLYISLDKDVMIAADSLVNWDSGHLTLPEVQTILEVFIGAAQGRLAGMDIVGDWSPVKVQGPLRRFLHLTEHPPLKVMPEEACRVNERTNLRLISAMQRLSSQTRAA